MYWHHRKLGVRLYSLFLFRSLFRMGKKARLGGPGAQGCWTAVTGCSTKRVTGNTDGSPWIPPSGSPLLLVAELASQSTLH